MNWKRIICRFKGHEWEHFDPPVYKRSHLPQCGVYIWGDPKEVCKRCGKTIFYAGEVYGVPTSRRRCRGGRDEPTVSHI